MILDRKRTAFVHKIIPDAEIRYVVAQSNLGGKVFTLQPYHLDVDRDNKLFAVDLYYYLLEMACKLARMAGSLRRFPEVDDKIGEKRFRLLMDETERADATDIGLDTVQVRAHLLRAMKGVATIRNRSKNPLLLQLIKVVEAHLCEIMPELCEVDPYETTHLSSAVFSIESMTLAEERELSGVL